MPRELSTMACDGEGGEVSLLSRGIGKKGVDPSKKPLHEKKGLLPGGHFLSPG